MTAATDTELLLALIEANQRAYEAASKSWKRFIPFWRLRREYQACKKNEPLWAAIGVRFEPLVFERTRGLSWSITRRLLGV